MNYNLVVIFGFSIAIAAIIGLVRIKRINRVYYPFLLCTWIALLNEGTGFMLAHTIRNNSINNNIYVLIEALLITWQFEQWGIFSKRKILYPLTLALLAITWATENLLLGNLQHIGFYFRILYSFIIVLMSIHTVNGLIITERKNIMKNSVFLICIAFIIYYSLKVMVQTFWLYGLNLSREFRVNLTYTMIFINLLANLIYAVAVLWMPSKHRFTMRY